MRGNFTEMNVMGAPWIRMDFLWSSIEPAQGVWDYNASDASVAQADAHGLKILGILGYGVSWLAGSSGTYTSPADVPYFVEFVNHTVSRYKGQVAAWESWNEPNVFWTGSLQDFITMLNATIATIHAISPSIDYVVGDLYMAQPEWLEAMFEAGIMTHVHAISFHPYFSTPDELAGLLRQELAVITRFDFKGQLWITEVGNPTGGYQDNHVSLLGQAIEVIYTYTLATAFNVTAVTYYEYQDSSVTDQQQNPWNSEFFFGLVFPNDTWKPGAYAFQLFGEHCSNSTYRPDLVQKSVSITSDGVVAALYRQPTGESTLILWYEPPLATNSSVQVQVNLNAQSNSVYQWDIYTGTNQSVSGGASSFTVNLSATPVFITFDAQGPGSPISLQPAESPSLLLVAIGLPSLLFFCVWLGRRIRHTEGHDGLDPE
jgi:hypothetical protein